MESIKQESNWSGIVKNERTPFNLTEWPTLELTNHDSAQTTETNVPMAQEMHIDPDFPYLEKSVRKRSRKRNAFKLSQALSYEKSFEMKFSNKVRKKITKTTHLGSFMNQKPPKVAKSVELEKILKKIEESHIVTFRGKKREIPRRNLSRLKKNILRIRTENQEKHESVSKSNEEPTTIIDSLKNLKIETTGSEAQKEVIQHSRQFRAYCNNTTSPLLCELTEQLIVQLHTFQTKQHQKNPEKYKKRFVTGIHETKKFLELKKVKLLIIAPDLEPNAGEGGLDETVNQMKAMCEENHIPYLFSLKRRKIGYILFKKIPISCVGILSYESCEELYGKLMNELTAQRERYSNGSIVL